MHIDLRCCNCSPHDPDSSAEKLRPCGARDAMGEFGGDCSRRDIHSFDCCRHGPIRNPTCRSASASAHGWFDPSALLGCKPASSPPGSSLRARWCRQWGRCARTPRHGEDISASCAFQRRVCFLHVAQAVFGGFTPLLVSWLAHLDPIGPAHYVAFTTALGALSLLLIPSTAQLPRRGWTADSIDTPGEA
jgi:hypothetical protein